MGLRLGISKRDICSARRALIRYDARFVSQRGFSRSCNVMRASREDVLDSDDRWGHPIYASDRLRDRKSVFLAHASALPTSAVLEDFISHLVSLPDLKKATHCMYAYRTVPDPTNPSPKVIGQNDGGEKGSGERLTRLLEALECENVVVVVSRWYGGVKLGSDRWKLISTVAKEALHRGHFVKEKAIDVIPKPTKPNVRRKGK